MLPLDRWRSLVTLRGSGAPAQLRECVGLKQEVGPHMEA